MNIFITIFLCLATAGTCLAEPASEAWTKLVGEKMKNHPAFSYVKNDPALPNVLIYGDSISIAYTQRVRDKLKDVANVYRIHCNGNHSGTMIENMTTMHKTMEDPKLDEPWNFEWDVIYFNVGLHDLKHLPDKKSNPDPVNTIEVYKANLKGIVAYLEKEHPKAKLVFATTTPVPEGERMRVAGSAKIYNTAALEVLNTISIDDLHAFTLPNYSKWATKPNNVHYKEVGYNAQGDHVARIITQVLK